MTSPTAEQITAARTKAGQSRTEAARTVGTTYRAWLRWERGERTMHYAVWALYKGRTRGEVAEVPSPVDARPRRIKPAPPLPPTREEALERLRVILRSE